MTNNNRVSRGWPALLLALLLPQVRAGIPALVRDLNTNPAPVSSNPTLLGKLGQLSLYSAVIADRPRLVRSDGTTEGTFVIKTFDGTGVSADAHLVRLFQAGSKAYFVAHEAATGLELWVTDGTADGTRLAADLNAGAGGSSLGFLGQFDGRLVFQTMPDNSSGQLHVTDGTPAGTVQLTNFPESGTTRLDQEFAVAGGKFYFTTHDTTCLGCVSVWSSNGTLNDTQLVPGFGPGNAYQDPRSLRGVGNRLLLTGLSAGGRSLFSVDATDDSTTLLVTAQSGPVSDITVLDGFGYLVGRFEANSEEVWRSDGTPGGTAKVTSIQSAPGAGFVSFDGIHLVNNLLVIPANDGVNGQQLWATNGTPGNQTSLTAIPGITGWSFTLPRTGRRLLVSVAANGVANILGTDGTPAGTRFLPTEYNGTPLMFLDMTGDATGEYLRYSILAPGLAFGYGLFRYTPDSPAVLTRLHSHSNASLGQLALSVSNGALLFNAPDNNVGNELWISDSTGTRLLANFAPDSNNHGSNPWWLTDWNGRAVYVASDGVHGYEIFESDGTEGGTRLLVDIVPGAADSFPSRFMVLDGALYFFATDGTASRLMKIPREGASPEVLATLAPPPGIYTGFPPATGRCGGNVHAALGGELYFSARSVSHGVELWVTDGTIAGTREVADIHPGGDSVPCDFTAMGGRVYFSADAGTGRGGIELWSSDGTAAGTRQVADLASGDASSTPWALVPMGNSLYFHATAGAVMSLYQTDGSTAGTKPLSPADTTAPFGAFPIGVFNGKLLLLSPTGDILAEPHEIWTSDGTPAGTTRVPDVLSQAWVPPMLTESGSSLYFANVVEGTEHPWITDGTAEGTRQVADLSATDDVGLVGFLEFRGKVVIATYPLTNFDYSGALWQTDGTPGGTRRLGSGPIPSIGFNEGKAAMLLGQRLVYAGFQPAIGMELHMVPNDRPIAVNDTASASYAQPAVLHLLSNDSDPDGTLVTQTLRIVQGPTHGTLRMRTDGVVVYYPAAGYSGTDSFTYAITDDQGFESNVGTVSVTVSESANRRGGGALEWWSVLALGLLAFARLKPREAWPAVQR